MNTDDIIILQRYMVERLKKKRERELQRMIDGMLPRQTLPFTANDNQRLQLLDFSGE